MITKLPEHKKIWIFGLFQAILILGTAFISRVPQNPSYHLFADNVEQMGIPYFQNVVSNLIFLFAAIYGTYKISKLAVSRAEKIYLGTFIFGLFMTSFGSAYYHLSPNHDTLVWDRFPMTIGFVGFFCWLMHATLSVKVAKSIFIFLLLFGFGSIYYWQYTEAAGHGDLRPYLFLQFGTIFNSLLLLMLYRNKHFAQQATWLLFTTYILAKIAEIYDHHIFALTQQFMSGHTLKHLFAGVGCMLFFKYYHSTPQSPQNL